MLILRKITVTSTLISMISHTHMCIHRDEICNLFQFTTAEQLLSEHCSTLLRSGIQGDTSLRSLAVTLHSPSNGLQNVSNSCHSVQKGQHGLCSTSCMMQLLHSLYTWTMPLPCKSQRNIEQANPIQDSAAPASILNTMTHWCAVKALPQMTPLLIAFD